MAGGRTRRARVAVASLGAVVALATLPFLAVPAASAAPATGTAGDPAPVTSIATGADSSCMVSGGAVSCWGRNANGELGNGTTKDSAAPVVVPTFGTPLAGATVTQVAVGDGVACALTSTGTVACWGGDGFSRVGSSSGSKSLVPISVSTSGALAGKTVTQISALGWNVCALTSDGIVACWGYNGAGEVGDGTTTSRTVPTAIVTAGTPLAGKTIASIDSGDRTNCALATDGTIGCWGQNTYGQLGNGTTTSSSVPVAPTTTGTALQGKVPVELAVGAMHTCARSTDGSVACWGYGLYGALGRGSTTSSTVPVPVTVAGTALAGQTVASIDTGGTSTCARLVDGGLACWGANTIGQLGTGSTATSASLAVSVLTAGSPLSGQAATGLAVGDAHACAAAGAAVACWGQNSYGQLGNGVTGIAPKPGPQVTGVLEGASVADIEGGQTNACARTTAGAVACWGDGTSRANGIPGAADSRTPVWVAVGTSPLATSPAVDLAVGSSHACATSVDGSLTCWGSNGYGQLGRPGSGMTPGSVATAGSALAGKQVAEVVAGDSNTCARTTDGTVACWGYNADGQLGNGSTTDTAVPTAVTTSGTVLDGKTITDIAHGTYGVCALASDSTVACWGRNGPGLLGNGSSLSAVALTPVAITKAGTPLAGKTIVAIEGGESGTVCALTSEGGSACWGEGSYGSIGDGSGDHAAVPTAPVTAGTPLAGRSITQVSPGYIHVCWLGTGAVLACAGNNTGLGNDNGAADAAVPTAVTIAGTPLAGKVIKQVTSVGSSSCALTTDSVISCWGLNWNGEMGNGIPSSANTPQGVVGFSTPVASVPGAPTIGTATPGAGSATVTWTAPASDGGSAITGYSITPSIGGVPQAPVSSSGSGTSKVVTGLVDGTAYTFRVAAVNAVGTGPASAASSAVTPRTTPGAPTSVSGVAGDGQVTVSWAAPSSNGGSAITDYVIVRYVGGSVAGQTAAGGTGTSKVVTGLANGTAYTFRVAAVNAAGQGSLSAASSAVTPSPAATAPGAPSGLSGVAGDGQVALAWTAPATDGGSPITGYVVTPFIGASAQTPVTTTGAGTSKLVTGLANGTAYTFTVAAVNAVGTGAPSPASAAVTPKLPYAPFASWGAFVDRMHLDLTAAAPTASARSQWVSQLQAGTKTKGDLVAALRLSADNTSRVDPTVRLYRALLGRAPDAGGLEFWITRRRSGNWTLNKMATSFSSSSEFQRKYGSLSNRAFVTQIYTDVLGREADPGGVEYWTSKLDTRQRTRGTVMVGFSESNEYKRKQAENTDVAVSYIFLLGRVPTADETAGWTSRQKAGTTVAVLAGELLDSAGYAASVAGS